MVYTFEIAIVVFAYLVVIIGGYLIRLMLRRYEKEVETSGLRGAGMVIGIVERIMVLTFVLVDQYTAITVIFAAKSIARFNELKDRKMAEYYLIGTLSSITFALLAGIVVRAFLVGKVLKMFFILYTWVCLYLHVTRFYSSPPISNTRFCKEEEKEWINRRLPLRFRFAFWAKAYLSVTGAIHPLILMTEQRKDFIMYRLHIQDCHHLRALVKDCNTLKHLEDTPDCWFLCRLAPLIR